LWPRVPTSKLLTGSMREVLGVGRKFAKFFLRAGDALPSPLEGDGGSARSAETDERCSKK
jgi:hypothetical protein